MKNKIIHTKNSRPSCIGYDDKWLMISTEELHTDIESLLFYTKSFHKSGTNGYSKIEINTIKEIKLHKNHSEFFIRYQKEPLKLRRWYLSIEDKESRTEFCNSLAHICCLNSKNEYFNPYAKLASNVVLIIVTLLLTWAAVLISKGGIKGLNRPIRQFVADHMEMIGPIPFITIGGIITSYFIYKIIKNLIKPTKTIIYT